MLFEKNFQGSAGGNMDLFSSFFSAMKSFVTQLVAEKSSGSLKALEMGNQIVRITSFPSLNVDLVIIADKGDEKKVEKKLIPSLEKILITNKSFFHEFDGELEILKLLTPPILDAISKIKGFDKSVESMIDKAVILDSIWNYKTKLEPFEIKKLIEEREQLELKLKKSTKIKEKFDIISRIVDIDDDIQDKEKYIADCEIRDKILREFNDIKLKLDYYLKETKTKLSKVVNTAGRKKLSEMEYRDIYLSLLNFSGKLNKAGAEKASGIIKDSAHILMDKDDYDAETLSNTLKTILNLDDDINTYLI